MSKKQRFRMALNPSTGNLEWAPDAPRVLPSMLGWLIAAVSFVLFLAIAGYFAFVFLLSSPRLDVSALPGGGPSVMRQEVQRLSSESR
jgi:hypothetical protein